MFKKRELLFLGLFGLSAFNVAEAKSDFFDKFYVRGNAYVGYNYSMSNYSMVGVRNNVDLLGLNDPYETKSILRHSPIVGVGANLYFKISKRLDLLAGVDITGRIPVGTKTEESRSFNEYEEIYAYSDSYVFQEYAKLNAKLGVKVNFNKSFAVESYGLAGINVAKFDRNFNYVSRVGSLVEYNKAGINIGTVFGAGANFVIKDRYTVGVEYYNSRNARNISGTHRGDEIGFKSKLNIHNVLVKFGVQF